MDGYWKHRQMDCVYFETELTETTPVMDLILFRSR